MEARRKKITFWISIAVAILIVAIVILNLIWGRPPEIREPEPTPTPEPTIIVPEIPSGNVLGANRIDPEIPLADGGRVLGASRAQTGDESNLLLWILLMLASAAGMGVVYRKARKERRG